MTDGSMKLYIPPYSNHPRCARNVAPPLPDVLTDEQQANLFEDKIAMARDDNKYLARHPEIKAIISLILRSLFHERPRKIAHFVNKFVERKEFADEVAKFLVDNKMTPSDDHGHVDKEKIKIAAAMAAFTKTLGGLEPLVKRGLLADAQAAVGARKLPYTQPDDEQHDQDKCLPSPSSPPSREGRRQSVSDPEKLGAKPTDESSRRSTLHSHHERPFISAGPKDWETRRAKLDDPCRKLSSFSDKEGWLVRHIDIQSRAPSTLYSQTSQVSGAEDQERQGSPRSQFYGTKHRFTQLDSSRLEHTLISGEREFEDQGSTFSEDGLFLDFTRPPGSKEADEESHSSSDSWSILLDSYETGSSTATRSDSRSGRSSLDNEDDKELLEGQMLIFAMLGKKVGETKPLDLDAQSEEASDDASSKLALTRGTLQDVYVPADDRPKADTEAVKSAATINNASSVVYDDQDEDGVKDNAISEDSEEEEEEYFD